MASSGAEITSSIPACNPTTCAPCYYTFNAYTVDVPWEIVNETSTVSLVAYVTEMPDGSLETEYSTINQQTANATDDSSTTFVSEFVWTEGDHTLTYPTSYLSILGLYGKGTSQWEPKSTEVCAPTANLSYIELPEATDPAFFLIPITTAPTLVGTLPSASATGSGTSSSIDTQESSIDSLPTSVLSYLDSLPTVKEQFGNAALTSCLPATKVTQPELCTEVKEVPRLGPCPGMNRTSTCTLGRSNTTITSTQLAASTGAPDDQTQPPEEVTTRISAGSLTNKIVSTSYVKRTSAVPAPVQADEPDEKPEQGGDQQEPPSPLRDPDDLPSETAKEPSQQDSPTVGSNPNPASQGGQDDPPSGASSSQADTDTDLGSGKEDSSGKEEETGSSGDNVLAQEASSSSSSDSDSNSQSQTGSQDGDTSHQNSVPQQGSDVTPNESQDSEGSAESPHPGLEFGVLNSAIQEVASQAAASQAAASQDVGSATAQNGGLNADGTAPSPNTGATNQPTDEFSGQETANAGAEPGTFASAPPVFTFRDQTLTAGGAATFGGSVVSELPNQEGVVVDGTRTVQLADGQATTVIQNDKESITVSQSGSIYIVDGQTLSPGQQITAGRTIASLGTSTAVLHINGVPTTLAGPSITLAGTVYTAAAAAAAASPSSDGGLGGFIYSGMGGSEPVPTSTGSTEATSDGTAVAPFTGDGLRLSNSKWTAALCALAAAIWMI